MNYDYIMMIFMIILCLMIYDYEFLFATESSSLPRFAIKGTTYLLRYLLISLTEAFYKSQLSKPHYHLNIQETSDIWDLGTKRFCLLYPMSLITKQIALILNRSGYVCVIPIDSYIRVP